SSARVAKRARARALPNRRPAPSRRRVYCPGSRDNMPRTGSVDSRREPSLAPTDARTRPGPPGPVERPRHFRHPWSDQGSWDEGTRLRRLRVDSLYRSLWGEARLRRVTAPGEDASWRVFATLPTPLV